jgi:putative zinc finger/helix-turn-helix YgiT family protein
MKCTECGNAMTKSVGQHHYTESGLDNVILHSVTKYECESCGAKRVVIPAVAQLHRTIARELARKPARLVPAEVAFLRDHLELSNKEFADLMGVSPEHASRWTSSDQIGVPAERFLRMLAVLGPEAVAQRKARSTLKEQLEVNVGEIVETLGYLPSRDEPVREVSIGLRRAGAAGWKAAAGNGPN